MKGKKGNKGESRINGKNHTKFFKEKKEEKAKKGYIGLKNILDRGFDYPETDETGITYYPIRSY